MIDVAVLTITARQLQSLRRIRDRFPRTQRIPAVGSWRNATADDVWIRVFYQVVVVGRAQPGTRLYEKTIRARISWKRLSKLPLRQASQEIWTVLREIGARYAGKTVDSCRKTRAIVSNLEILKGFPGGPKAFLKTAATLTDDPQKILFVSQLSYFKGKGARDFLTSGFGILRNSIAIDARVKNALKHLGIHIPSSALSSRAKYAEIERILLDQICKPLKISGAQLDQLLFYNYWDIRRTQW